MFNVKRSLLALIGAIVLCSGQARADSFVIRDVGGFVFVAATVDAGPPTLKLPPAFHLFGPGFSVETPIPPVSGGDVGNVQARDICQSTICAPGTVIGTNSSFSGILAPPLGAIVVVNGVSYFLVSPLAGSFNFVSPPIVLPDFRGITQVTVPFSFSGELTGQGVPFSGRDPITFTATLSGQGLATFRFEEFPPNQLNPQYKLDEIDYEFQTPEPATVLLLSSGVTSLVVIARRRKLLRTK